MQIHGTAMQQIVSEITLPSGLLLQVVHGDITEEETDAIVNAANSALQHGGGVAAAIVRKGGQEIQEESNRIGNVQTGSAAVTGGGALPATYVIHAVGPVWQGGERGEEPLLASAVESALAVAEKLHLESIAIPAISSGIFGFPKERCVEIIVDAVNRFSERGPHSLRNVRCTNIDGETVQIFKQVVDLLQHNLVNPGE